MKYIKALLRIVLVLFLVLVCFQSCYSVRLRTIHGVGKPDPNSTRTDYYRDLMLVEKDTTITIGIADKDFTMLLDCDSAGLQTVEYRNTLGGLLLSAVTLGRKRRVNIKYVCMLQEN